MPPPTHPSRCSDTLSSQVSILSVTTLLSICAYSLFRHFHLPPAQQRASAASHLVRFCTSEHFILLANLLVADLIKAIGFFLNIVVCLYSHLPLSAEF